MQTSTNATPLLHLDLAFARALRRAPTAHKGDAGKVLLVGGAPTMAGALWLAGKGALYCGAGWVVLAMLDSASAHAASAQPELMLHDANAHNTVDMLERVAPDVLAIGPGLGTDARALQWLQAALGFAGPLVLDADALNLIAQHAPLMQTLRERSTRTPASSTVLTPHPGEAARLLQSTTQAVQAERVASVLALVERTQAVVVLKGHRSLVAAPQHAPQVCEAGNPGMAAGGMGDVLTGAVAALLAQGLRHGLDTWQAAALAVQAHAMAGDALVAQGVGPIGLTASEVAVEMRRVLNALVAD